MQRINANFSGWLLIDKPEGITSATALNKIKRFIKPLKIGHAGTLDPFASGMLLVAIGEATKLMQYALNKDKEYIFSVKWGSQTDTLDKTGIISYTSNNIPDYESIASVLPSFIGDIEQTPPQYSAISINGKRAYAIARSGGVAEIQSRIVSVHDLRIIKHQDRDTTFSMRCGKGCYVRSIANDIAIKLRSACYVNALRRTSIGKFLEKNLISLATVEELMYGGTASGLSEVIMPLHEVLDDILVFHVSTDDAIKLKNGLPIPLKPQQNVLNTAFVVTCDQPVAICKIENSFIKPMRVFNFLTT